MIRQIEVMLVEDNPDDVQRFRNLLTKSKSGTFVVDVVHTLEESHEKLQSSQPDVILLDLSLPDSAGIDTLFDLHETAADTPIIVLTDLDEMTMLGIQAVKGGAQDYIIKSDVDAKVLRRAIHYAIERHEVDTQLRRSEEVYRSLIDDVFDLTSVGVFILDADFIVRWCNEATETYFDVEREDILGKDKRQLIREEIKYIFADPDDFENRVLESYELNEHTRRFECHVLPGANRAGRWLQHWSQPIRDGMYKGGRIEQYTDITHVKSLEFAEREQRIFAEVLRNIATSLTSTLDLEEVLGRILSNLSLMIPHDSASITMIEKDHWWVAHAQEEHEAKVEIIRIDNPQDIMYRDYLDHMMDTHTPLLVDDMRHNGTMSKVQQNGANRKNGSNGANGVNGTQDLSTYLGTPILLQDEVIGFINLMNILPMSFRSTDAEQLKAVADLAAIALRNAQSYSESRQLAALEERQRLARDLHDSVSQTLFTCRTMLETALKRFDNDPQRANELVSEVHQQVITALSEMRILLLELRPNALTQVGLKHLFEQYLQPIRKRSEFDLNITIDDLPDLPADVQIALYRIAQEAVNNISKHALAQMVSVAVSHDDGIIEMEICDDGVGFAENTVQPSNLGIKIMRERAAEINAQLTIDSKPDTGTWVKLAWRQDT